MALAIAVAGFSGTAAAREAGQPRFALLRTWLDSVERHQPGHVDPALLAAAAWSRADLVRLRIDISVLLFFCERPTLDRVRFIPSEEMRRTLPPGSLTSFALVFDGTVLDELRALAHRALFLGLENVARRGALLHTDLVTMGLSNGEPATGVPRRTVAPLRVSVDDGELARVSFGPAHWELARLLVDRLGTSAAAEGWAAEWLRATVAYLQRERQYRSALLEYAINRAPADPRLLLLAGAEHEALASPAVQSFIRAGGAGSAVRFDVQSVDRELAEAERLLRHALEADASLAEARVRLGRVLGLRGRHAEAVTELRAAIGATDPVIEYYANLFLGAELIAQSDVDGAQAAFGRAAERHPLARSVRLGLAYLAWRSGSPSELSVHLQGVLAGAGESPEADPWQYYHSAQGRDADAWLRSVRAAIGAGSP